MKHLILLLSFLLVNGLNAQLTNNASYNLSVKFDQGGYTYSNENSRLNIQQGSAQVSLDFNMTDPKTASTNYVHVDGSGDGSADKDKFSASGSGFIITYERGKEDSRLPFSFSISGDFSLRSEGSVVLGNFSLKDDNSELTGRISGKESLSGLAKLIITRGSFKINKNGSNEWVTGRSGMSIEYGDKIESSDNTRINLTFPDGSIFIIKSNSVVGFITSDDFKVELGELYFRIGKQGKEFQVITPSLVCGDLGTKFIVTVDNMGSTDVNVISGKVYVKDDMGKQVTLSEGEHVSGSKSVGVGTVNRIDVKEIEKAFDATDSPALNSVESAPQENSGNFAGKYDLVANNYKGMLEFSNDMKSGRIFFDIANKWEEITNLTYNALTGELSFTRPWSGNPNFQKYSGRISGNKITGVFTDVNYGSQEFPWEAMKK